MTSEPATRMDPEIKKEWVAALRSGEYEQGRGCLQPKDGEFCCLGVLTDLAIKHGVLDGWATGYGKAREATPDSEYLPDIVVNWAGLSSDNPIIAHKRDDLGAETESLGGLNDDGTLFNEIADLIEEEL